MARLVCIFPSIHYLISDDDSKRSFLRHLFASAFVHETVSSTDNKRQQANDWNDKTFPFMQTSPPVQLGQKLVLGRPANPWLTSDRNQTSCMKMKRKTNKFPLNRNTPPTPPGMVFLNLYFGIFFQRCSRRSGKWPDWLASINPCFAKQAFGALPSRAKVNPIL